MPMIEKDGESLGMSRCNNVCLKTDADDDDEEEAEGEEEEEKDDDDDDDPSKSVKSHIH